MLSTLGILRADSDGSGELVLDALYPGIDEREIHAKTGWNLRKSANFQVIDPPTYEELKILRYAVDPSRMYLGRTNGTLSRTIHLTT